MGGSSSYLLAMHHTAHTETPAADLAPALPPAARPAARQPQGEARPRSPRKKKRVFPRTFEERLEIGVRVLRVPATWEEYLELADTADYRVQYREGQIISFLEIEETPNGHIMGEATIPHETLVIRFATQLSVLLDEPESDFLVLGSNLKLFLPEAGRGVNADVTVVKGEPVVQEYFAKKRKSKGVTNPWLVVEVLSNSTRDFDLSEKLNDYKQIPSLQQIIFAEQGALWASTYIRIGDREWQNLDFNTMEDAIPLVGTEARIPLRKIFARMF